MQRTAGKDAQPAGDYAVGSAEQPPSLRIQQIILEWCENARDEMDHWAASSKRNYQFFRRISSILPNYVPGDVKNSHCPTTSPKPNKYLPLSELGEANADTGSWLVDAFHPIEDKYECSWQIGRDRLLTYTSRPRANFVVTLVSVEDPHQYCQAHFRKKPGSEARYEQTKKLIYHSKRFVLSRVCFLKCHQHFDANKNSCPLKVVVDLASSNLVPVSRLVSSVVQPFPTATVAGSASAQLLATRSLPLMFFEVTAMIT